MTPAEWGARGYEVLVATYGEHRINQWRRRGGRKPIRSLAEIQAATGATRTRTRRRGATPSSTSHTGEGDTPMAQDKQDLMNTDYWWVLEYRHALEAAVRNLRSGHPDWALEECEKSMAKFDEHVRRSYYANRPAGAWTSKAVAK